MRDFSWQVGIGTALPVAAERHALEKGCSLTLVSSHGFQAPRFYARRGYREMARVDEHPPGHKPDLVVLTGDLTHTTSSCSRIGSGHEEMTGVIEVVD